MPSVAMNPFFEELASNYPDTLFLLVDVDEVKVIRPIPQSKIVFVCVLFWVE